MTTTSAGASDLSDVLAGLPLKTLDPGGLVLVVLDEAERLDDAARIRVALHAATFLHRHQTRASRAGMPRTPYVEHPLRNALRLLRWGVTDTDVVVAAILHDVVEDCSPDIVRHALKVDLAGQSDSEQRVLALGWVDATFGAEVARLVEAVTNPLVSGGSAGSGAGDEDRRSAYLAHVRGVVVDDPSVLLVKLADIVDNAAGLHHTMGDWDQGTIRRLALKYLPVLDLLTDEIGRSTTDGGQTEGGGTGSPGLDGLVPHEAPARMIGALEMARERLTRIIGS